MEDTRRARRPSTRNRSTCSNQEPGCTLRRLCVRCSMMRVVQYRFAAFRRAFGRDPLPHEPLFFAARSQFPVAVDKQQAIKQISRAAEATGVQLSGLLNFLNLDRRDNEASPHSP